MSKVVGGVEARRAIVRDGDLVRRAAAEVDWEAALPARASRWPWRVSRVVKRMCDVAIASVGLLALLPLFLLLSVAIVADSGCPLFYPWHVVGHRGRRFRGYKFRTMVREADQLKAQLSDLNEMNGPVFKIQEDPRVTRLGKLLRRYSLDELPQLVSVVLGDMSLVGPRPMFAEEFVQATPDERRKLAVTTGITCLWQVSGRSKIGDFSDWVRLDREYIESWSLWLDLRILLKTVPAVIRGVGAY